MWLSQVMAEGQKQQGALQGERGTMGPEHKRKHY